MAPVPGITDFIASTSETPIRTPAPEWSRNLSEEDIADIMRMIRIVLKYHLNYMPCFFLQILVR